MALTSGAKLGPYEIQSALGAGGMGEVYRARDTRLDRTVAIKVLNSTVVSSPELKQRFEREARIVSRLNHPHICTLHDVGHQDGTDFLAMEYLEGEMLAQRLTKGALAVPDLLKISIDILDGLEHAHRAGVVHRDLEPGNVMLDRDLLRPRAARIHRQQGPALPAATRAMCPRVQRRARVPFAAAGAATHDLCCAGTDRALARLSRDVAAVLAHRAGAPDAAPASKSARSDNFIQGGRLCSSIRPESMLRKRPSRLVR
jgi:serine/threonine protein kinase